MAILLSKLLEKVPEKELDTVKTMLKRHRSRIQSMLRKETGFLLNRDSDKSNRENVSVPIEIKDGLPQVLEDFEFNEEFELALFVSSYRRDLESANNGLENSIDLFQDIQNNELWLKQVKNKNTQVESTIAAVKELLELFYKNNPLQEILAVNEDVMGCYWYKTTDSLFSDYDYLKCRVELYWAVIGLLARMLNVPTDSLTIVVLIHELAHAYTHLGMDIDGNRWKSNDFANSSTLLKETLAQYYTHLLTIEMDKHVDHTHSTYKHLLDYQSFYYRSHLGLVEENTPEQVRLAMVTSRRLGRVDMMQFIEKLIEAEKQLPMS